MKTLEDKLKAGEENANKLKEALALEKKLSSDKNSQVNAGAVYPYRSEDPNPIFSNFCNKIFISKDH